MMKKIIVAMLALVLLCASASAASWPEGLGPQKPYTGSPEVDFSQTIGYMMLMPVNGERCRPGTMTLKIYLPREDVRAGEGVLYLHSEEDNLVTEIAISAETMIGRAMTEEELEAMLWGCGTMFEITMEHPLEANRNYIVQMTEGCIVSDEYEAVSPAIAGRKVWTFNTDTENYVDGLTFKRMVNGQKITVRPERVEVGDTAEFTVAMGKEAVFAVIYCDAGTLSTETSYMEVGTAASVYFPASGTVEWGVVFFNAENMVVDTVSFITTVNAPTAADEAAGN